MKIVKAVATDVEEIIALTRSCARHMIAQGIFQWNEHYPSMEVFKKDIALKQLWKIMDEGAIAGVMVLTEIEDDEYDGVSWLTKDVRSLYIHRLAVHPNQQGKGVARKLLDYSEHYAIENKYASIRLDTFSQNKRNQRIYEKRGYVQLEDIFFPKQSEHPFHCFEKVLDV